MMVPVEMSDDPRIDLINVAQITRISTRRNLTEITLACGTKMVIKLTPKAFFRLVREYHNNEIPPNAKMLAVDPARLQEDKTEKGGTGA